MKTKFDNITRKSRKALLPLILLTTTQFSYAGGSLPVVSNNVMVTKNLNNKKHKVKLFTASDYKTLLFTVDGMEMEQYTLFIFDLEGRLITQSVILNRETGILPEITSGTYLYEVLAADAKVENGQLKIK
jgi:hypothetical protein